MIKSCWHNIIYLAIQCITFKQHIIDLRNAPMDEVLTAFAFLGIVTERSPESLWTATLRTVLGVRVAVVLTVELCLAHVYNNGQANADGQRVTSWTRGTAAHHRESHDKMQILQWQLITIAIT